MRHDLEKGDIRGGWWISSIFFLAIIIYFVTIRTQLPISPPDNPARRVVELATAIRNTATINVPESIEIFNRYKDLVSQGRENLDHDAVSLGKNGELFPKHAVLAGFITAPFLLIFGEWGLFLCQLSMLLLVVYSLFSLSKVESLSGHFFVFCLICFGTQLFLAHYAYTYGFDIQGTAILLYGLCRLKRDSFFGSMLGGLTLFIRPSFVLWLPLFVILAPNRLRAFLGILLSCGFFGLWNWVLYGAPWITAYQRLPIVTPELHVQLAPPLQFLQLDLIQKNWFEQLFNPQVGLILYSPLVAFIPVLLCFQLYKPKPRSVEVIWMLIFSLIEILFVMTYQYWNSSILGNRLVLTSSMMMVPCVVISLYDMWLRLNQSSVKLHLLRNHW